MYFNGLRLSTNIPITLLPLTIDTQVIFLSLSPFPLRLFLVFPSCVEFYQISTFS